MHFGPPPIESEKKKKKKHKSRHRTKEAYLILPNLLHLHQPNHGRNPPHIHLHLDTDGPNTPPIPGNPAMNLLTHVLAQDRLADEIRIQRERPLRQLLWVIRAQLAEVGHVFRDAGLVVA